MVGRSTAGPHPPSRDPIRDLLAEVLALRQEIRALRAEMAELSSELAWGEDSPDFGRSSDAFRGRLAQVERALGIRGDDRE